MEEHRGEILERIIRKNNISITELALQVGVSRSKVYEWFRKENLNAEIIFKVSRVISYNFALDFPELFLTQDQLHIKKQKPTFSKKTDSAEIWKNKYIVLLEKYTQMLAG